MPERTVRKRMSIDRPTEMDLPVNTSEPVDIDKSSPRVRRMFGEIADRYDLLNHLLSLNIDRYWRWRTVRRVPPVPPGAILDLCTGTGDLAIAYFKAAGGKSRVIGADFCRPMLAQGMAKGRRM